MDALFMNTVESVSEHGLFTRMATYERNAAECRSFFFRLRLWNANIVRTCTCTCDGSSGLTVNRWVCTLGVRVACCLTLSKCLKAV